MEMLWEIVKGLPLGFLTGLLLNGTLIVIAYWLFWNRWKTRLVHWRIQLKERVDMKQIRRELGNSLLVLGVGAFFSGIVTYWGRYGYTQVYLDIDRYPIWVAIIMLPLLVVVNDTWFYWCHRLLHHPWVYKYVHLEHHKSVDVNPFTSMSFHLLEPTLLTGWIFIVALTVPVYAPVLLLLHVFGLLENIKSHLGYEIYPRWFNRGPFRWLSTSTYHNMHHSKFHGNYGLHFRFWDRVMGTEMPDYEQTFDAIQDRKATVDP